MASVSARPWVSTRPTISVAPCGLRGARRGQHRVGLAHAGRGAEEDLQLAAARARLVLLHLLQQLVGVGALIAGHGHNQPARLKRQYSRLAAVTMAPSAIG